MNFFRLWFVVFVGFHHNLMTYFACAHYFQYGSKTYVLHVSTGLNWTATRDACVADNGTLLLPDTPEEQQAVSEFYKLYTNVLMQEHVRINLPCDNNACAQHMAQSPEFWSEEATIFPDSSAVLYTIDAKWYASRLLAIDNNFICQYTGKCTSLTVYCVNHGSSCLTPIHSNRPSPRMASSRGLSASPVTPKIWRPPASARISSNTLHTEFDVMTCPLVPTPSGLSR